MRLVVRFMYTETIIFGGLSRLIMRKIVCDMCGEEIDTSYMDKYDIRPKARLEVYGEVNKDQIYNSLEYDLCINCTQKVVDLIKNGKG